MEPAGLTLEAHDLRMLGPRRARLLAHIDLRLPIRLRNDSGCKPKLPRRRENRTIGSAHHAPARPARHSLNLPAGRTATAITASLYHSCAVLDDGSAAC